MSGKHKAVRANLYSVHWENDRAHGYFHETVRILAYDAAGAIAATKPTTAGVHLKSVDLLAERIVILLADCVLEDGFQTSGPHSDEGFRAMLGSAGLETFHAYRESKP